MVEEKERLKRDRKRKSWEGGREGRRDGGRNGD